MSSDIEQLKKIYQSIPMGLASEVFLKPTNGYNINQSIPMGLSSCHGGNELESLARSRETT